MSLAPGTVIASDFRIVSPLAQGGMGEVYVAEQISTGKRRALKLMKKDLVLVPGLLTRFEQEAKIGARIESEHIVEVVGAGVDPTHGMPWLAMELLEGQTLEAMLTARGSIPIPEARTIFAQVGHAVGGAHRAGVVHRDLKPENIFVARTYQIGGAVRVKVLDFGIAKLFEDAKANNTTGSLSLGTPRYMAPEQTGGQPITPAADVWALGLIVYRALTGNYYWRHAKGGEGDTVVMLMREILFEPLVPASRRASEQAVANLWPIELDAWFARCVAREPTERFQNGDDATRALLASLGGETGPVTILTGPVRASKSVIEGETLASPMKGMSFSPGTPVTLPGSPVGVAPPAVRSRRSFVGFALAGVGVAALGGLGGFLYLRHSTASAKKKRNDESVDESEAETETTAKAKPSNPDPPPKKPALYGDLAGAYDIVDGVNPPSMGGAHYNGSVVISTVGDTIRIEWHVGSATFLGVGFVEGDDLLVAFGSGSYGAGVYSSSKGTVTGRATSSDGAGVIESQTLVGPSGFQGEYKLNGAKGPYGNATLTQQGNDLVQLRGDVRGTAVIGTGLRRGDRLFVGWATPGNDGGVVLYRIAGKELNGVWAAHISASLGSERLRKR